MSSEDGRDRSRRDRDKYRVKEAEKEKERHRSDKKEKHRDRDRESEREREERKAREREEYEKEKARLKEKEKEKRAARERELEEYEREKEIEKEKEKERKRRQREFEEYEREKEKERRRKEEKRRKEREKERERERKKRDAERGEERESERKRRKRESEEESRKPNSHEEDEQDEQKKLEDEVEKRRRRVQEWQDLKRKKEELERENEEEEKGKNWTLDGESDEEEEKGKMVIDSVNGDSVSVSNGEMEIDKNKQEEEKEEIDPLDAFMNSMVLPEVEKLEKEVQIEDPQKESESKVGNFANGSSKNQKIPKNTGRIMQGEDSDTDSDADSETEAGQEEEEDDEDFLKRVKKTKAEKLAIVDHSKVNYPPFRKSFYIEPKEITKMPSEEVVSYRKQLELKVHGKDVPKPIKTWVQTGLTSKLLETLKKLGFEKPMPIQTQALPVIMSGRDCIGIAKTGSGKTLAFVLPMLRHIKDQNPVIPGEGPIALVMAPTRELVQQIHSDIKKFSKGINVNCVAVYGGSGVAQQISDLKRGCEIVVCTPGRMIDILSTSGGKISNLRRVTYLVMDEADRMFDMGFEPQIGRIVQNARPDRQTVLFSATFPRQVEILARRVLNKPVEIQVGGRSVVNKDITQLVEIRTESDRFNRLLELLGEWYEKGKILVFVHSQDKCDTLFKELLKHGYPCLSLHGGKDQTDRESTITDFKTNVCNLLIATSVAARGLDVKDLELVVNFDVPNHYEDYVHRVGRTGRAGRKGLAVTFISEEEERYAPDLLKALELSEQSVPDDLRSVAGKFMAKVKQGTETVHGTGYGGSGFKFNEEEDDARKAVKKAQMKEYGYESDKSDSDSEDEVRKTGGSVPVTSQPVSSSSGPIPTVNIPGLNVPIQLTGPGPVSLPGGITLPGSLPAVIAGSPAASEATARAVALAAAINIQHNLARIQAENQPEHYEAELEINGLSQPARWRITHKDTIGPICDWTGAAITTRGQFVPPGRVCGPGERKLYLFIEGKSENSVKKAKAELKKVLEQIEVSGSAQTGKYSVI